MEHWGEALRITVAGLGVVFGVMSIIALATWISGRVFVSLERREQARKKKAGAGTAAGEAGAGSAGGPRDGSA